VFGARDSHDYHWRRRRGAGARRWRQHRINRYETIGAFSRPVRRRVSKGVEDSRRLPTLLAGHPQNGRKAVLEVARPQGVEGLGMKGQSETLGSLWILLAIRAWPFQTISNYILKLFKSVEALRTSPVTLHRLVQELWPDSDPLPLPFCFTPFAGRLRALQ
jgi:hypothetical protein